MTRQQTTTETGTLDYAVRVGIIRRKEGRAREGIRYLERWRERFEEEGTALEQLKFHNTLAPLFEQLGDYESALTEQLTALYFAEQHGDAGYIGINHNNICDLYLALNKTTEAKGHIFSAIRIFTETNSLTELAQSQECLARVFIQEGNYIGAVQMALMSYLALANAFEKDPADESLKTFVRAVHLLLEQKRLEEAGGSVRRALVGLASVVAIKLRRIARRVL